MTVTNIRFPGQYLLKVSVTEEALKFMIPSMLLQPFVENSIKHGIIIDNQKKQGIILIQAWTEASAILHIVVTDNGCGMTEDKINDINDQKYFSDDGIKPCKDSIGIHNIFKRIKLLNTTNRISFGSKLGYYTKVHLQLYLIQEQGNEIHNSD
jgi:two-component system sensor histidine kinase YesM